MEDYRSRKEASVTGHTGDSLDALVVQTLASAVCLL